MSSSSSNIISQGWNSAVTPVQDIRNSILFAFLIFFLFASIICRSNTSMFDHIAARKVARVILFVTAVEICWMSPLIYCVSNLGSPITIDAFTSYGKNGQTWLYGYGRPCMGISFMAFGVAASMHPTPRIVCMIGCIMEIIFDSLSAFQVRNYCDTMVTFAAPAPPNYTRQLLLYYYWRDVTSIAVAMVLLLMTIHLTILVGCCHPPMIPYRMLEGGDLDRCEIMRQNLRIRREIDEIEWHDEQSDKADRKKRRQEARRQLLDDERRRRDNHAADDIEAMQQQFDKSNKH